MLSENYGDARPVLAEYMAENNRRSDNQNETLGRILDGVNQFNSTVGNLELEMERFQKETLEFIANELKLIKENMENLDSKVGDILEKLDKVQPQTTPSL